MKPGDKVYCYNDVISQTAMSQGNMLFKKGLYYNVHSVDKKNIHIERRGYDYYVTFTLIRNREYFFVYGEHFLDTKELRNKKMKTIL